MSSDGLRLIDTSLVRLKELRVCGYLGHDCVAPSRRTCGETGMKVERERQQDMNKRRREAKEDERARSGQIEDQWWSMKAQISDLQ